MADLRVPSEQSRARRRELLGQLSVPLRSFLRTESGSAAMLLAASALALAWANSAWSSAYEDLWATQVEFRIGALEGGLDLKHVVNDGLMALFFFVIGMEVRREFSMGELTKPRRAIIPLLAGLGGMAVPVALYLALAPGGDAGRAWGVVIGTDTAFLLGALALVGPVFATQLRVFLLTVTVIDDIVAVTVIGLVYSDAVSWVWLGAMSVTLVLLTQLNRLQVWRAAPYVIGVLSLWVVTVQAGLHASIAGMLGGLLVAARPPARERVDDVGARFRAFGQSPVVTLGRSAREALQRAISVNERLQLMLHPWVSYVVVPVFALANAGVDLRDGVLGEAMRSSLTWAVVVGLVVGKLVGIGLTVKLSKVAGWGEMPRGVESGHVLGGAALSGIGFTVSLLIVGMAFDEGPLRDQATVGVLLAAVFATFLGWLMFKAGEVLRGEGDADLPRTLDRAVEPGRDHILGPASAALTLVEYGDFECPFCANRTGLLAELSERFDEELRYVFRHLPLPDVHPHAELASAAALAADQQGAFWPMHDILFEHQDELQLHDLVGYASALALDVEQFLHDINADWVVERIREDVASAEASGATGTPTFFIGSARHTGPYDADTLAAKLDEARSVPVSSRSSRRAGESAVDQQRGSGDGGGLR